MRHALTTLALLALSALAAEGARRIGLPLPYMLGPLLATAAAVTALPRRIPQGYAFPPRLRITFIAVIGLMIGAEVTPALFADPARLALSALALTLFVALCFWINFSIFRRIGGYDRPTALYASAPGGLYESIAMGEAAGADMPRLMLQQFLRVIVVVTALPFGLSFYLGGPVGSAAGLTLAVADVPWSSLPGLVLAGAIGVALGRVLRLPAGQITGPMAVAAAWSLAGMGHLDVPEWLVMVAQLVVGCALGTRFTGLSPRAIARGAGLAALSVTAMLTLAAGLAVLLKPVLGQGFDVLLISLAPGGVTEMALVALSLSANPAFVTLHHIGRILITVAGLGLLARLERRRL